MLFDNIKAKIIEISKELIDYYKQPTAQKISVQEEFTDFRRKNKADFNRFQTECEIFKLRRDDLSNKMFQIDEEIEKYINGTQLSPEAKEKLQNRWNECINEDKVRIDSKRKLKIISTQKEFYKNHQLTRLPGQPKCTSSINSTKFNVINDEGNNHLITEVNQQEPEQSKNELIPVSPERTKYMLRSSTYQEKF